MSAVQVRERAERAPPWDNSFPKKRSKLLASREISNNEKLVASLSQKYKLK